MGMISEMGLGFVTNAPLRGQMDHEEGWDFSTFGKLMKKAVSRGYSAKNRLPGRGQKRVFYSPAPTSSS